MRIGTVFNPGDMGNAGVAQCQQMAGREITPELLVHMDGAQVGPLQVAFGNHHRLLLGHVQHIRVGNVTGQDDDAIHPARGQQLEAGDVGLGVPVAAHDDGGMAARLQPHLDTFERTRIKLALNRLGEHTHRHGDAGLQAAGKDVGAELELGDRRLDGFALGGCHLGGAVQYAGYRARRHPGHTGDLQQGHRFVAERGSGIRGEGHAISGAKGCAGVYAMPPCRAVG